MKKRLGQAKLWNKGKYCTCLYMLSLLTLLGACASRKTTSHKILIVPEDVEAIKFWYFSPGGDFGYDGGDIVFTLHRRDTLITDRRVIERYAALLNRLDSTAPNTYYGLQVASAFKFKEKEGKKRKNLGICVDYERGIITIDDSMVMKSNRRKLKRFVFDVLYDPLPPDAWNFLDYRDSPEESKRIFGEIKRDEEALERQKFLIRKIKRKSGYWIVYAERNDSIFKIVSEDKTLEGYDFNPAEYDKKLKRGMKEFLELVKIFPTDSLSNSSFPTSSGRQGLHMPNGDVIPVEKKSHSTIYRALDLRGCYYIGLKNNRYWEIEARDD